MNELNTLIAGLFIGGLALIGLGSSQMSLRMGIALALLAVGFHLFPFLEKLR